MHIIQKRNILNIYIKKEKLLEVLCQQQGQ